MASTHTCTMHAIKQTSHIEAIGWLKHPTCTLTHYERTGVLVVQYASKKGKRSGLYYYAKVDRLLYANILSDVAYLQSHVKGKYPYKRVDIGSTQWAI